MATSHDTIVESRPREQWADNLRVIVIAGVIVVHTATAYLVDIAGWYYQERTTSDVWLVILSGPVLIGVIFALGPLFLVAGWFSARSLAHRGPGGFMRSRLLRLGLPLVVFVLLIDPLTAYLGGRGKQEMRTVPLGTRQMEVGVLWFVAALLVFSAAYAVLRRLRPAPAPRRPLRTGVLATAALVIAVSSFAVWQVWPANADMFGNLRVGGWPQSAVLFALGVLGAEAGWLEHLPPVLARRLGWVAAAGVAAMLTLMVSLVLARGADQALAMGADLPTMAFALLDGVIAVSGTLWFIAWLRGRWPTHGPLLGKAARASYATYVIHLLVLTAVMVALSSVALAPEIKFLLVAAAGVAACFTAGYALTRVPGIAKVL